jgi:hypothetical protein
VYQCGGCGAVLKAKIRKIESRDMELHQPDSIKESRDTQDQESNGLNHGQTGDSSFRESVLDKSNEDKKSSDHSSTDHENSVNAMSSVDSVEAMLPPEPEPGNTTLSAEPGEATPSAELGEATSSADQPDEARSSAEPGEATSSAEPDEARSSAELDEARSSAETDEARSSAETEEARSSAELDEPTSSPEKGKATSSIEFGGQATSPAEPNEAKSSAELNEAKSSAEQSYENGCSSLLPETYIEEKKSKSLEQSEFEDDTESDENPKTRPLSKSSSEDSFINSTRVHSFATAQGSFAGSIMTDIDYSPPIEEMFQEPNRPFERISSTETFENLPRGSQEMDPRFMLDDISKSLTTKSHYAYYGSESSCNENEYCAQPRFHAPKRILKDKGEFSGPARHVPRAPLYPRGDQASPSTYGHSKFEYDSMYKRDLPESSKVELFKMVCDLQDQLDRKYKQPFRYNQGENRPSQPIPANRNAFSSEASHFRHQPDCSCLRCIPQEQRRYSSQLTRNHMSRQNPSYSSSPVHYTGSEYSSWSRETNLRHHTDRDFRRVNISEKRRHCRPVAGGSPIIACYKCSSLLQIPADFLVFKKKFHLLRCHNHECSEVLKFSVIDGVHLVRYTPPDVDTSLAPPPSEVDEYNNIKNTESVTRRLRNLHLASDSRVSEQISSSVDYSRSSTDGEFQRTVTSFVPVKEGYGKSVMNEKSKSRKSGPALHRLMGYASPSKVWRANMNEV